MLPFMEICRQSFWAVKVETKVKHRADASPVSRVVQVKVGGKNLYNRIYGWSKIVDEDG
jgi:hypothetical protein